MCLSLVKTWASEVCCYLEQQPLCSWAILCGACVELENRSEDLFLLQQSALEVTSCLLWGWSVWVLVFPDEWTVLLGINCSVIWEQVKGLYPPFPRDWHWAHSFPVPWASSVPPGSLLLIILRAGPTPSLGPLQSLPLLQNRLLRSLSFVNARPDHIRVFRI